MSDHSVAIIDRNVQETNRWLNAIQTETGVADKGHALAGLRAVLITLRDTLPVDLAANLGDQLPVLIRGFYYENYVPSKTPQLERRPAQWAASVADSAELIDADQAKPMTRAVFALLRNELDAAIIDKVTDAIPREVRAEILD